MTTVELTVEVTITGAPSDPERDLRLCEDVELALMGVVGVVSADVTGQAWKREAL